MKWDVRIDFSPTLRSGSERSPIGQWQLLNKAQYDCESLFKFDEGVACCLPQFVVPLESAAPNLFLVKGRTRHGDVAGPGLLQKEFCRKVEVQVRILLHRNTDVEHVLRPAPVSQGLLEQCAEFLRHNILELTDVQGVRACDVNLDDPADWVVETHREGHGRVGALVLLDELSVAPVIREGVPDLALKCDEAAVGTRRLLLHFLDAVQDARTPGNPPETRCQEGPELFRSERRIAGREIKVPCAAVRLPDKIQGVAALECQYLAEGARVGNRGPRAEDQSAR